MGNVRIYVKKKGIKSEISTKLHPYAKFNPTIKKKSN